MLIEHVQTGSNTDPAKPLRMCLLMSSLCTENTPLAAIIQVVFVNISI